MRLLGALAVAALTFAGIYLMERLAGFRSPIFAFNLHFILITTDISENSREQILKDYAHYPVVQHYTEADVEKFFALKGTKVLGFAKSGLAQSIYAEMKQHRINKPAAKATPASTPESANPQS